jgi:hypothetical protein
VRLDRYDEALERGRTIDPLGSRIGATACTCCSTRARAPAARSSSREASRAFLALRPPPSPSSRDAASWTTHLSRGAGANAGAQRTALSRRLGDRSPGRHWPPSPSSPARPDSPPGPLWLGLAARRGPGPHRDRRRVRPTARSGRGRTSGPQPMTSQDRFACAAGQTFLCGAPFGPAPRLQRGTSATPGIKPIRRSAVIEDTSDIFARSGRLTRLRRCQSPRSASTTDSPWSRSASESTTDAAAAGSTEASLAAATTAARI